MSWTVDTGTDEATAGTKESATEGGALRWPAAYHASKHGVIGSAGRRRSQPPSCGCAAPLRHRDPRRRRLHHPLGSGLSSSPSGRVPLRLPWLAVRVPNNADAAASAWRQGADAPLTPFLLCFFGR